MSHRYDSSIFPTSTRRERPPLYPVQDRRIHIPKTKTREIYFKGERGDRWAPHHHHPHHATAAVPAEAYTTRTLRQRVHRASHPSCTTSTTPKQTNVTLHPAADGSPRITSPRILTSASAFAGTSPPRRRRSALGDLTPPRARPRQNARPRPRGTRSARHHFSPPPPPRES